MARRHPQNWLRLPTTRVSLDKNTAVLFRLNEKNPAVEEKALGNSVGEISAKLSSPVESQLVADSPGLTMYASDQGGLRQQGCGGMAEAGEAMFQTYHGTSGSWGSQTMPSKVIQGQQSKRSQGGF